MSINTQQLYEAKALKFNVSSQSDTYNSAFMEAMYKTLADIQNHTGLAITSPTDTATDIDIGTAYYPAVSFGIDFYLQDSNMFTANPIPDAEARFIRAMKVAQRVYLQTLDLESKLGPLESYTISGLQNEGYSA